MIESGAWLSLRKYERYKVVVFDRDVGPRSELTDFECR